jgi:hypothetical protein
MVLLWANGVLISTTEWVRIRSRKAASDRFAAVVIWIDHIVRRKIMQAYEPGSARLRQNGYYINSFQAR